MGKKKTYQVNKIDRSQQHKRVDVFRTLQVPSNPDRLYPNLNHSAYTNDSFASSNPNLPNLTNTPMQTVWSTSHPNSHRNKKSNLTQTKSSSKKVIISVCVGLVVFILLAAVIGVALYYTLFNKQIKCNRECFTNEYCVFTEINNKNPKCECKPGYKNESNKCIRTSQTKCFSNYEPYTYLNTQSSQIPASYETKFLQPYCCPNKNYFTSQCCGASFSNFTLKLNPQRAERIIGGAALPSGVFPWIVHVSQVYRLNSNSSMQMIKNCTGALLNDRYVLTAAHCIDKEEDIKFNAEFNTIESMMRIHFGFIDKTKISPLNERKISKVYVHPKYDSMFLLNDLAILRLDKPVNRSMNADYLCLFNYDKSDSIVLGLKLYTAGWGSTSPNHLNLVYPDLINYVDAIVFPMSFCTYIYPDKQYSFLFNSTTHVCAGYQESAGKDTCYADSGAPLMVKLNEQWFAYGVVSFGSQPDCAKGPSMFTRISFHADWIKSIILN